MEPEVREAKGSFRVRMFGTRMGKRWRESRRKLAEIEKKEF